MVFSLCRYMRNLSRTLSSGLTQQTPCMLNSKLPNEHTTGHLRHNHRPVQAAQHWVMTRLPGASRQYRRIHQGCVWQAGALENCAAPPITERHWARSSITLAGSSATSRARTQVLRVMASSMRCSASRTRSARAGSIAMPCATCRRLAVARMVSSMPHSLAALLSPACTFHTHYD